MNKVCEVYLATDDAHGVELSLPVSQYEMMDAFEQIHSKSPGDVYWQGDEMCIRDRDWSTISAFFQTSSLP